ncbi:MAG: preprotein translocase subunit SecE [Solirubrobacteraceae bacterium]
MARNRQRAKDRKQKLKRENVPGSLDHASGEVEEAEAAIVAGAGGEPLEDEEFELEDVEEDVDESLDREEHTAGDKEAAGAPTKGRSGLRIVNFVRACVAELQRVQWPDRRQTGQATTVVLGFVVIAGAFLGLADTIAQRIIDFII